MTEPSNDDARWRFAHAIAERIFFGGDTARGELYSARMIEMAYPASPWRLARA
jgi:hypothetical protein